ncbi:DNA mismatch endonuclease Vsr [Mariprofundus erugo]|uniref:Very short patch repair endonuclease n=1 Tax=Mariprofundus erugo TaxID=2528639 RepID=A0A5R9GR07_9PROT|nr:very short patch repair endonuclease [Mariprofundus erugo]TLS68330.1 DNA mismatch endonuclease Vsr [Mariprofundus erugo]
MTDVVDGTTRSRMMAGIRGKNTKPEIRIRSLLHRRGFRFRIHVDSLPGKPDIVLKRHQAAIFVHGCFWHAHHCHLFKWPASRIDFWRTKIEGNKTRDTVNSQLLKKSGWRILTIWECALKGKYRLDEAELLEQLSMWLNSDNSEHEIIGKVPEP